MQRGVGFIGLGNMGMGMARNLMKAGFPLTVYDLRPEPVRELVAAGAFAAGTPREMGESVSTVVVMVLNFPQMEEVILGPEGVAHTLQPGSTVIGCSTVASRQVKDLAATLAGQSLSYVDAPVSGGKHGAHEGNLAIMIGAEPEVLEAQRPLLQAMAAHLYHCGPVGSGQLAKMCNQVLVGANLVATAECLALAAAAGLDGRLVFEIVTHSAGDSWMFRHRALRMLEGDFTTRGRLDIFIKDLGIVLETADQFNLPLLLTNAARQWATMGVAAGYGAEDDSAVVKVLEKISGVNVQTGGEIKSDRSDNKR